MANNPLDFMKDAMSAPLGSLIASIGAGVAEAQAALDAGSLAQTLAIYDHENKDELLVLLRNIGYQPTFYVIPETEVEANISISLSINNESTQSGILPTDNLPRTRVYATPINASNSNKFSLALNASAKLKFKIVPVPPPSEMADIRIIPTFLGKKWSEAKSLLAQQNLNYTLKTGSPTDDAFVVKTQSVAGGTVAKIGDSIEFFLGN
ncbi:MAG: hypothetical protein RI894_519 [Bacteroidota bacterium]|jgi:hypothetical protein